MKEIGVPESTLQGWLKDEDQLREFCNQVDRKTGLQRKKTKTAADPAVDKEVYDWFVRLWSRQHPHLRTHGSCKGREDLPATIPQRRLATHPWMATEIQGAARYQPNQDLWRGKVGRYSSGSGIHPSTTGLHQGG